MTGGSGFIGGNLVERLVYDGYSPVVFDNDSRGSKQRLQHLEGKIEIVQGNIRDPEQVRAAAKGCQSIFHLAFVNGTRFFYEKPELVLEVGVKGALNTLEVAMSLGVEKYVLASSSEVYQQPETLPTSEEERIIIPDVTNPRFSYSGGKIISELLTINYLRYSPIEHTIFRPHNVFGPNMGLEHVIPELMQKIHESSDGFQAGECTVAIQGTGRETRAFCYVEDAVDQIMTIFENGKSGNIYHVGMPHERSILELITDMGKILDISINVLPGKLQSGGTSRRCPDIRKVCALGYEQNDHYLEGLKKTVEWHKEYYLTKRRQVAK